MLKIGLWLLAGTAILIAAVLIAWSVFMRTIETPDYRLIEQDGPIELRHYPAMRIAEITRQGSRESAVRAGFGPLARYIFARDRSGEHIAMTAPVTQRPTEGESQWRVAFIMPQHYTLEELPSPAIDDIELREMPSRRVAAIRFSGRARDALIERHEQRLRTWLAERGLQPAGAPTYAYYNPPWIPGFLRRNEVLIDVAEGAGEQEEGSGEQQGTAPE
ncbi:MAG: SOUL family heme-binding protein [Halorhodospira sp.]